MSRTMKTLALILVPIISVSIVTWDLSWILPSAQAAKQIGKYNQWLRTLQERLRQQAPKPANTEKANVALPTPAPPRHKPGVRSAASARKKRPLFAEPTYQYPDRPTLKVHMAKEVSIDGNGDLIVDCYLVARKGALNGYHFFMRCPRNESPTGWKEVAYIWDTENDYTVPKTEDSKVAAKYKVASYNISEMAGLTEETKAQLAEGVIPGAVRHAAMEFADRQLLLSGLSEGSAGTNCDEGGDAQSLVDDPVDIISGCVVDECVDFSFPNRGMPVVLKRCYLSKESDIQTDLGYGWRHSYDMVLVQENTEGTPDIYYVWLHGEMHTLKDYGSYWVSWPHPFMSIEVDEGEMTITDDDMVYVFDEPGSIGWSYSEQIKSMTKVVEKTSTEPLGYTYSFTYHTSGDDEGKLQYLVDESDDTNILEFIYATDSEDNNRRKLYQVENKNNAVLVTYAYGDSDGNVTSATNPEGEAITYDYDDRTEDPDLPLNHKIRVKKLDSGVGVLWSFPVSSTVETNDDYIFGNASGDSYRVHYNDLHMGDDAGDDWFHMTIDYDESPDYVKTLDLKDGDNWVETRHYFDDFLYDRFDEIWIYTSETDHYTIQRTYNDTDLNQIETERITDDDSSYYVETAYTYDAYSGKLASRTVRNSMSTSGEDADLTITYDSDTGKVVTIKDAAGRGLFFEYYGNEGGWSRQVKSLCQISEYENGATTSGYNECNETQFEYYAHNDASGREWLLKKITDPMGRVTEFDYNSDGTLKEIEDPITGTSTISYSGLPDYLLGKPTKVTVPGLNGPREMEFSYDDAGRIEYQTFPKAKQSDSNRYKLGWTYNGDGLLSTLKQYYGATLVRTVTYTYHDETDWLETVYTDSNERKTKYEYFASGDIAQIIQVLAESGGEITSGRYTKFEYDNQFNLTRKRYSIDANNCNDEVYSYFPDGSLESVTYAGKEGGADLDSIAISYGYNSRNMLWTVNWPGGDADDKTFTYTTGGLIDTIENPAGTVDIDYDEFNRVERVDGILTGSADTLLWTWNAGYSQLDQIDGPNGYQQVFSYDSLDRLKTITGDGSKVTTYDYERITGRLSRIELANGTTADYTYDDLDRVVTLANQLNAGELINSYTYQSNTKGLRSKVTYANGSWADFTYDVVGQLTDEHYKDAQANSLLQLTYTYDKAGNRTEKKYDNDGTRVETYTVNGYNQLTAVAGTAREYTNVCGLIDESNVDTVTVTNASLSEDAPRVDLMHDYFIGRKLPLQNGDNNIEVRVTDLAGNSTTAGSSGTYDFDQQENIDVQYEYDVRGNMTVKEVKVGENYVAKERYFYNYDNLIECIWYADAEHNSKHPHFIYDGLNRRVRIEYGTVTLSGDDFSSFSENTTKEYVFLGTQPIVEYDYDSGEETRDVVRQYYWGLDIVAGIGGLLYQKVEGSPDTYYYYHYDGSGNVTAITDADKGVAALYEYDAFGNIITKAGTLANDFTFSTQMAYGASGWSMYMFRNYSPRLGKWTQRDPFRLVREVNVDGFCWNDPVDHVDALGGIALLTVLIIVAVAGLVGYGAVTTGKRISNNASKLCRALKESADDAEENDGTADAVLEDYQASVERVVENSPALGQLAVDVVTTAYDFVTPSPGNVDFPTSLTPLDGPPGAIPVTGHVQKTRGGGRIFRPRMFHGKAGSGVSYGYDYQRTIPLD